MNRSKNQLKASQYYLSVSMFFFFQTKNVCVCVSATLYFIYYNIGRIFSNAANSSIEDAVALYYVCHVKANFFISWNLKIRFFILLYTMIRLESCQSAIPAFVDTGHHGITNDVTRRLFFSCVNDDVPDHQRCMSWEQKWFFFLPKIIYFISI